MYISKLYQFLFITVLVAFFITLIFLNTPDPQSVPVISNLNQDVKNYTSTSSFEIADQILEINDDS